jgi:hypothetical protein
MKTIDQTLITKVQEVYFDLCDLINSGEIDDFNLVTMNEFNTLREFLEEQKEKLSEIEERISADEQ